jgi:hypothetical protein
MSNSKSAIQEIKNLMVSFGFMKEEVALQSFKLEDETILQAEKLEVGNKIFKINEAFEQVALENGSYKLKENFELEVSEGDIIAVKELFLDAKLKDGTLVKVLGDALVEGVKVMIVDAAGAEVPAPNGSHELEDGTKIEVLEGIVSKIEEAEAEKEVEDGEDPETSEMGYMPKMMEKEADMELISLIKDFMAKMGEKVSKMEQSYSSLENEFKAFKAEPAGKKIADGKVESFVKQENDNGLSAKIAALKALQNK